MDRTPCLSSYDARDDTLFLGLHGKQTTPEDVNRRSLPKIQTFLLETYQRAVASQKYGCLPYYQSDITLQHIDGMAKLSITSMARCIRYFLQTYGLPLTACSGDQQDVHSTIAHSFAT